LQIGNDAATKEKMQIFTRGVIGLEKAITVETAQTTTIQQPAIFSHVGSLEIQVFIRIFSVQFLLSCRLLPSAVTRRKPTR
jgi:hypothetical protein